MKHLVLLALVCLPLFSLNAQEICNTVMPEEMMEWLRDYKVNNRGPHYSKASGDITYIPIQFHIVGSSTGFGYYKVSSLLDAFCTLNNQYEPYGWRFYMYDDLNYIDNDNLNDHSGNYWNTISTQSVPNVVNMFMVDDPSGACGYFSGQGGPRGSNGQRQGYIAIQDGQCASSDNSTIAHELGHFFSLPHTFYGWEGSNPTTAQAGFNDERVDGSNCTYTGDYFCDTPADYLSDRWSCPYNRTKTDYVGDLYEPDGELYMSYSNDACTRYFSEEQVDAMNSYLGSTRSYMLDNVYPGYEPILDSSVPVLPVQSGTGVPANFVNLKWSKAENATQYLVQMKLDGPQITFFLDTIVSDTSMVIQLDEFRGYAYRVRAYNPAYTCSPMSNFNIFSTGANSPLTPTVSVNSVSCNNAFDGRITVNLQGGSGPYTYSWSNGGNTASIGNLTQGKYVLTVTDQNNETLEIDVDIVEPVELEVELEQVGNSLVTNVVGGSPSYTYSWSNGATGNGVQLDVNGDYSVTVTDANGCTATKTFSNATGINDVLSDNNISIYPNPVTVGQNINIDFELSEALQNASIEIYESTGRLVKQVSANFDLGKNNVVISGNDVEAGIYFIRLTGDNVSVTQKLIVL